MGDCLPGPSSSSSVLQDGEPDVDSGTTNPRCSLCGKSFTGNARLTNWKKHADNPPAYCLEAHVRSARRGPEEAPPPAKPTPDQHMDLHERLMHLKERVFLPDHIPVSVRSLVAEELTKRVDRVLQNNNEDCWISLLLFSYAVLGQPRNSSCSISSKEFSLAIRRNIAEKRMPEQNCSSKRRKHKPNAASALREM